MDIKIKKLPIAISIVMLLLAIFPMPYGYYTLLRLVICGTAIYVAYYTKKINKQKWMWTMIVTALLFNPLFQIHLDKSLWSIVDVIAACLFITFLFQNKIKGVTGNMKLMKKIFMGISVIIVLIIIVSSILSYNYQTKEYPIELVKRELSYKSPSEWLKSEKGDITFYGWEVKKVRDKSDTYLVSYTYATAEDKAKLTRRGWWWEVNTKAEIVRKVTGDAELEKRYGLIQTETAKEKKVAKEPTIDPELNREKVGEIKKEISAERLRWRQLQKGLTDSQVRSILGEPERINAPFTWSVVWTYPKGGIVEFDTGFSHDIPRVVKWTEPYWQD